MKQVPKRFLKFVADYPEVGKAYQELGTAIASSGPLSAREGALVKIGISAGARMEGALRSHVRKAIHVGVSMEEIKHAIMLTTTTIGFPNMMAALSWCDEFIEEKSNE